MDAIDEAVRPGKLFLLAWFMSLNAGFALGGEASGNAPGDSLQDSTSVYLLQHGWHSGVIIPSGALAGLSWAEQLGAADCRFLEIGWGDKRYYTGNNSGPLLAVRAAVFPTASVLHVVRIQASLRDYFPASEILGFSLDSSGLQGLTRYIGDRFFMDAEGRLKDVGRGKYGDSRFYLGSEKFHIFKTCNNWIGRALKAGGVPLSTLGLITASGLHHRAAKHGRPVP